jgi:hypothetical protein
LSHPPGTLTNNRMDAMNTCRNIVLAAAAVAAIVIAAAAPAAADPTPGPTPGPAYQIPSNAGPVLGGVQTYQPTCLVAPLACAMRYDPSRGVWLPTGDQ